jgi:hypothetical protein
MTAVTVQYVYKSIEFELLDCFEDGKKPGWIILRELLQLGTKSEQELASLAESHARQETS